MSTPPVPTPAQPRRLSPAATVMLFVVAPLVLLALIIGAVIAGLTLFRGIPVSESAEAAAKHGVSVEIPSATLRLSPSTDGQVHVTMTGEFAGRRPTLTATTTDGITLVSGGCPDGWLFSRCDVTVEVQMPAELPLHVQGTNGSISIAGLLGDINVETSNGRIDATGTVGDLGLRTVNGSIEVRSSTSSRVTANSTNGSIELNLSAPPTTVTASTTNGAITVRVPDDGNSYAIEAETVNGGINTDAVPSDATSTRTITAKTVNGSVTVDRSRQ